MSTRNLSADSITGAVIQRMRQAKSARFKQVMDSLVKHLHDFARDVKLTEQEWEYAIDFLTRTGKPDGQPPSRPHTGIHHFRFIQQLHQDRRRGDRSLDHDPRHAANLEADSRRAKYVVQGR